MKIKIEKLAADISRNEEVMNLLDTILTDCDDRAYLVCPATECANNAEGTCTIHLVKSRRTMPGKGRCADYVV